MLAGMHQGPRHGPMHYWVPSAHSPYHPDWRSSMGNVSSAERAELARENHGCVKTIGHELETTSGMFA
jgi:hypothetical protein